MFRNNARLQSLIGLTSGIAGILIPLGVILSLPAMVFGLGGLHFSIGKDKFASYTGSAAVLIGVAIRVTYSLYGKTTEEIDLSGLIISAVALLVLIYIFYRHISHKRA
ncbi:hypothetical protein CMO96_01120 [Candidatus Woesebacteria bacterium]|nr:hypothetical protein [Candidatus Woesebacteria bacterium]